jgi:TRAP-type C4-dicarboxylate transport system permease small subunit
MTRDRPLMKKLIKILDGLNNLLKVVGAACLMGMTLLTCVDVIGRYLGRPIFGAVELVGFMATLAAALALPYTHEMKGHIGVEILVNHFSEKTQTLIEACTNGVCLALFGVVTWRMAKYAYTIRESGEVSMSLQFPEYLIILTVAFGFFVFTLMIVKDIVRAIAVLMDKK